MSTNKRIGLLAAWGRYPVLVAEALRRQNYHVTCVGAADLADPALASICQDFELFGWGRLGGAIRYFRPRNHVSPIARFCTRAASEIGPDCRSNAYGHATSRYRIRLGSRQENG